MSGELPGPLERLGRQLTQVAAERAVPRRRWRARLAAGLVVAGGVVGVAGVAGAGQLIGIGEEAPERRALPSQLQTTEGGLALSVADPRGGPRWGLRLGSAGRGRVCAVVGRVRGSAVGVLQADGRVRPLASDTLGVCGRPAGTRTVFTVQVPRDPQPTTLVYGRAASTARSVRLEVQGRSRVLPVGPGGSFLAVFAGRDVDGRDVTVAASG